MNESYAEAGCKRKPTMITYLLKGLLAIVAVVLFLLTYQNQILLLIAAVLIVGIFYMFPRFNVQYEYIFCDGQIDFDKIYGNSKRKTALRVDFEHAEICAPSGSHSLDSYAHNRNLKVKNFSSRDPHAKTYVLIVHEKETLYKIIFEPNEKMIACIKAKSPRKLVEF